MLVRAVRMHNGCVCRAMCDDPRLTLTRTRTTRTGVYLSGPSIPSTWPFRISHSPVSTAASSPHTS